MSIVLEEDNTAAWEFINSCRHRMVRLYKHNIDIIRSMEKSSFGKNSYFRLVENRLFKTPKFEGDYSGQAPYSDTEDEEENATKDVDEDETTEDTGDNDVSGDQDNVVEYSDPENMTDGIESGGESDTGSDEEDDGEE